VLGLAVPLLLLLLLPLPLPPLLLLSPLLQPCQLLPPLLLLLLLLLPPNLPPLVPLGDSQAQVTWVLAHVMGCSCQTPACRLCLKLCDQQRVL
jgi:hypothetical protein